jgi:hypothetical protein
VHDKNMEKIDFREMEKMKIDFAVLQDGGNQAGC